MRFSNNLFLKIFVGPYTKYRSDLVVNLQYVCLLSVLGNFKSSDWSTRFMLTRALIGQHKLGDTKPVLWQCGRVLVYTNWYKGWIYCTTVNGSKHSVCTPSILWQSG
jgi:hypothetical protein